MVFSKLTIKIGKKIKDYYQILSIPHHADIAMIKNAYRKKVKETHPDLHPDSLSKFRFLEIQEAYEILANPKSKLEYDHKLKLNLSYIAIQKNKYHPSEILKSLNKIEQEILQLNQGQLYQNNLLHYLLLMLQSKIIEEWKLHLATYSIENYLEKIHDLSKYLDDPLRLRILTQINAICENLMIEDIQHYKEQENKLIKKLKWRNRKPYFILIISIMICLIIFMLH